MRDFPLRPGHGSGNRLAHGVEIEAGGTLFFGWNGWSAEDALDIGMDDGAVWTAAHDRRQIDAMRLSRAGARPAKPAIRLLRLAPPAGGAGIIGCDGKSRDWRDG